MRWNKDKIIREIAELEIIKWRAELDIKERILKLNNFKEEKIGFKFNN